jgi:hypothetical protein
VFEKGILKNIFSLFKKMKRLQFGIIGRKMSVHDRRNTTIFGKIPENSYKYIPNIVVLLLS